MLLSSWIAVPLLLVHWPWTLSLTALFYIHSGTCLSMATCRKMFIVTRSLSNPHAPSRWAVGEGRQRACLGASSGCAWQKSSRSLFLPKEHHPQGLWLGCSHWLGWSWEWELGAASTPWGRSLDLLCGESGTQPNSSAFCFRIYKMGSSTTQSWCVHTYIHPQEELRRSECLWRLRDALGSLTHIHHHLNMSLSLGAADALWLRFGGCTGL